MTLKTLFMCLISLQLAGVTLFAEEIQATRYRHPATGLVFPDTVAGIAKGKVTNFEEKDPGLGVSVGYNAPGITVTVYVYTLGLKSIASDPSSPILKEHFMQVVQDIYEAERLGHYKFVKKVAQGTTFLRSEQTGPQPLFASFSYAQKDTKRLSTLYLMGHKQHFVKIRFTYDKAVQAKAEETLAWFLHEIGNMLEAVEWFDKACALLDTNAGKFADPGKAIEYLNQAIRLEPDYAKAYVTRGVAYILLGNQNLGCPDLRRACELGDCEGYEFVKNKGFCR